MLSPENMKNMMKDRNAKEVSRKTDISYSSLNNFLAGRIKAMSYENMVRLNNYLQNEGQQ